MPNSIEDYLKQFGDDLSSRILDAFPPLHSPQDPLSPILRTLKRTAFPAQALTVMAAVKRLEHADSVAVIGEWEQGKLSWR